MVSDVNLHPLQRGGSAKLEAANLEKIRLQSQLDEADFRHRADLKSKLLEATKERNEMEAEHIAHREQMKDTLEKIQVRQSQQHTSAWFVSSTPVAAAH